MYAHVPNIYLYGELARFDREAQQLCVCVAVVVVVVVVCECWWWCLCGVASWRRDGVARFVFIIIFNIRMCVCRALTPAPLL